MKDKRNENVCIYCGGDIGVQFTHLVSKPAYFYCNNKACKNFEKETAPIPKHIKENMGEA